MLFSFLYYNHRNKHVLSFSSYSLQSLGLPRLRPYLVGYTTTLCPILIGMSGTIYNIHTVQALRNLGLPGRACQKLCQKLHSTALAHLHSIVAQRRILEHEKSNPNPQSRQWSGPNSHTSYSRKKHKCSPD